MDIVLYGSLWSQRGQGVLEGVQPGRRRAGQVDIRARPVNIERDGPDPARVKAARRRISP